MPDQSPHPERNFRIEEEERRLQEELRRLHELKQQREAGNFSDFLEQDAQALSAQRSEHQQAKFSPEIPGITKPSAASSEIVGSHESESGNPVHELNASLARGQENLAENIISGKADVEPADMEDTLLALLDSSEQNKAA